MFYLEYKLFKVVTYLIIMDRMELKLGDSFQTLSEARNTINRSQLDDGLSYRVYKSDSKRYIINCRNTTCPFKIRASKTRKDLYFVVTIFIQHSCSPTTHYNSKARSSLQYLLDHHRAAVINDRNISISNNLLSYSYSIIH
jgi:hypothetical protein